MAGPDGSLHLAVAFRPDLADHPLLQTGVDEIVDFVSSPGVTGVAPLVACDRPTARFVYPAPEGVSLAQVLAGTRGSSPGPAGLRAAFDLIVAVAPLLDAAAQAGRAAGVRNHGALSPWRIVLRTDGAPSLIGYGLPPVHVLAWLDEETDQVDTRALATTPPERIEDNEEDVRADLYALALVAAELAIGRPVLQGTPVALVDTILGGGVSAAIGRALMGSAPRAVTALSRAVAMGPDDRYPSGAAFADAVQGLVSGTPGPTLTKFLGAELSHPEIVLEDETSVQYSVPTTPRASGPSPTPSPRVTQPPPITAAADDAPGGDGEEMLVAPVPELPPHASLDAVRQQAKAIVERTMALAEQAGRYAAEVAERADSDAVDFSSHARASGLAADRVSKAASSGKSAASLLELDEDAAGALITLDLVRNAEAQAEGAAREAADQLKDLRRVVERARQQQQALREAVQRARQHATSATEAADAADALVTQLELDARGGLLAAPEVDEAIDQAIAAAERAHASAAEARVQADAAGDVDHELATTRADDARQAEEEANRQLSATRDASDRARRVEAESRGRSVELAARHASEARSAADAAGAAVIRADDATALAGTALSGDLKQALTAAARDAGVAATEAERASASAHDSPHSGETARLSHVAERAARAATQAASRATQASDGIVQLAGAVAEARAAVAERHDEASRLLDAGKRATTRAREEVDQLFQDTRHITTDHALETRAAATSHVQLTEQRVTELQASVADLLSLDAVEGLDLRLEDVRALSRAATEASEQAHTALSAAREACERELAQIARREAQRAEVVEAATEAANNAKRCREQVDAAWTVARDLSDALQSTTIDEAIRLRTKALELVDIAEFQSGEANNSAALASAEEDPVEARAHAQTARSFLERISADLPEALDGLRQAEELAQKERRALTTARERCGEIARTVERIARDVQVGHDRARTEATEWRDVTSVAAELGQLGKLARSFDEDANESSWCADQATRAVAASDALDLLPKAESALERARDKQRHAQAIAESLAKAIAAAVAERQAIAAARKTAIDAVHAVAALLSQALDAEARLTEAVQTHAAQDVPVANAQLRMRESRQRIELTHKKLVVLADQATAAPEPAIVKRLAGSARDLLATAESSSEVVTEAETAGTAAAEHEARARQEARQRRLLAAAEDADAQAGRARALVVKIDKVLDEAEEEASSSSSAEARAGFERATDLAETLRRQVSELERVGASVRAQVDDGRADALAAGGTVFCPGARRRRGLDPRVAAGRPRSRARRGRRGRGPRQSPWRGARYRRASSGGGGASQDRGEAPRRPVDQGEQVRGARSGRQGSHAHPSRLSGRSQGRGGDSHGRESGDAGGGPVHPQDESSRSGARRCGR